VDVPIGDAQAQNATATFTSMVDAQATAFVLQTSDAVATEVYGTQTAEFQMTAAAAETARAQSSATPPPVFTMNGTFGISKPLDPCNLSTRTSGTVNITVDLLRGSAGGQLTGSGSQTLTGLVCQGVTYDVQCSSSYTGNLAGSLDGSSGALQLAGQLSGSNSCVFTNCQQNGIYFDCPAPQGGDFSLPVTLKGTVNLSSRTGKGIITSSEMGEGDWHAGE